jgi:hypothetical protein
VKKYKQNVIKISSRVLTFTVLAALFAFTACNEDKPDNDQDFVFNLDKYFTMEEGMLSLQTFPDTSNVEEAPHVDSVYGENIVPEGGQNQFNVIMTEPTQSILIGVAGENYGFYQILAPESGPVTDFSFAIDFANEDFKNVYFLKIAGIDEDGNVGIADSIKVITIDAALGNLAVSCEWDELVDIDLYLQEPNGDTIYFDNPTSANLGYLDMDSNPFCWLDSINTENIYYEDYAAVEAGTYNVLLRYLSNCNVSDTVQYAITITFDGDTIGIPDYSNPFRGSFGPDETYINPENIFSFTIASDAKKSTYMAKQRLIRFGYTTENEKNESVSPEKSKWEKERKKK